MRTRSLFTYVRLLLGESVQPMLDVTTTAVFCSYTFGYVYSIRVSECDDDTILDKH